MHKYSVATILLGLSILLFQAYTYSQTTPSDCNTQRKQKTIVVTSKTLDKRQIGLRIYKPEKCYNGYTLFTHQSLGGPGIIFHPIYLIDMKGNIIHQWMTDASPIFARLKPDGHLLYADGENLRGVDAQSNEIWHYPGCIDHAFQFLEDGNFLIARHEYIDGCLRCQDENNNPSGKPRIEIITRDKKVLWQWRGEEHVDELERLLGLKIVPIGRWCNNNACEILKDNHLGKKDARFRKGNIIFSFDALSVIGVIDYSTGEILWVWGPGIIQNQHTPTMLDNGNLLIFDNGSGRHWSRVIELNPLTEQIVWEYHTEPKEDFYSHNWSNAQRLANGNTLICEGIKNRIFEITPEGEIVWDFISTFNKTTGGETIYRAYRYSPEYVKPLLEMIRKVREVD